VNLSAISLTKGVLNYIENCRIQPGTWQFASTAGGPETLYGSCFAVMLRHYIGDLDSLSQFEKDSWAEYINSWQDAKTGYYRGPELAENRLTLKKHSLEHLTQHLTIHVLPALNLLGHQPVYPLSFAHPFADTDYLSKWVKQRDWRDAWLEGNNLIIAGQLLIYLRDVENISSADSALQYYFDWLDEQVDPQTGFWGSNGYCSALEALYGGYHQLLIYYYENHPIKYPEKMVDLALSLQHPNGSFNPAGNSGACEDVDTIDILVNLYKMFDYKRPQIRRALRKGAEYVLSMLQPDGGFIFRKDRQFMHMGIQDTYSKANVSNLFPTWFRLHTFALIGEVITDDPLFEWPWKFNDVCSMGWHRPWDKTQYRLTERDRYAEHFALIIANVRREMSSSYNRIRRVLGRVRRSLIK
jgi:hypothetical protein